MSGAGQDVTISVRGHQVRITFETIAMVVILVIVIFACLVGFWSKGLADRVVELKDTIMDMLSVLGGVLGLSLTRGHMDNKIQLQQQQKKEGGP